MKYAGGVFSNVASPALLYFPHDFINGMIFEKWLLNIKHVFRFSVQLLSGTFLITRSKMCASLRAHYPLFLFDCNET